MTAMLHFVLVDKGTDEKGRYEALCGDLAMADAVGRECDLGVKAECVLCSACWNNEDPTGLAESLFGYPIEVRMNTFYRYVDRYYPGCRGPEVDLEALGLLSVVGFTILGSADHEGALSPNRIIRAGGISISERRGAVDSIENSVKTMQEASDNLQAAYQALIEDR